MKRAFFAALLALTACQQQVQHGLDEQQANEIEALLNESGIEARKVRESGRDAKWAISVPSDRTTAAVKLLNDHGLPRKHAQGFAEVFGKGSMVPTAVEENALYVHALSGELSQTLETLDGVLSARVHIVASPSNVQSSFRPPLQPRAAVLLRARNGKAAQLESQRDAIRALVAGSVEGMQLESVSVMVSELPSAAAPAEPRRPSALLWPFAVASGIVALLAVGLVFALLRSRRLRLQIEAKPATPAADEPEPSSKPAIVQGQRAA
jgi:type III secretion protein J